MGTVRVARPVLLSLSLLVSASLACNLGQQAEPESSVETQVAGTLTALPSETPAVDTPTPTAQATEPATEPPATDQPTQPPAATATDTPPPNGVSLNCDGTYQRVRILDQGAAGKTISVDNWDGNGWVNVWSVSSGDPNLKQLTDDAGWYQFGGCQKLVIVPFRHSNPQLWFELAIYAWNGAGMSSVYAREGYYGEWEKLGDLIRFRYASLLGYVNNGPLGPCEWTTFEHTWNGAAFAQTGSLVEPVANCQPIPTATP